MNVPSSNDERIPFEFNGKQKAQMEALSARDARLVGMYFGAQMVLDNLNNAESLAQACHRLRDLMEEIPRRYEGIPAPEQLPKMGDKVRGLAEKRKRIALEGKTAAERVLEFARPSQTFRNQS